MLNNIGTKTIETDRLILRKFIYKDNADMRKNWAADEKVQSLYCEPVYDTKEKVEKLLEKYIFSYERNDYYRWAIILKDNQECIGQIAYYMIDDNNNFGEVEYCIGSEFQCKGLATEATKAIIDYGFRTIKLHKVQISHKSINMPSKRVIEKSGFHYDGCLRDYFYEDKKYIDRLYYSILENEYFDK